MIRYTKNWKELEELPFLWKILPVRREYLQKSSVATIIALLFHFLLNNIGVMMGFEC